jgi:hypothetical protein
MVGYLVSHESLHWKHCDEPYRNKVNADNQYCKQSVEMTKEHHYWKRLKGTLLDMSDTQCNEVLSLNREQTDKNMSQSTAILTV